MKPKREDRLDKVQVAKSLRELETLRNEKWHEGFITRCVAEFEIIGFDTYTCIERINNAKLSKEWGTVTKFEHFMNADDEGFIIDTELVELKAKLLLDKRGFYNGEQYEKLIQYWDNEKNSNIDKTESDKLLIQINAKLKMKEIFDKHYKALIEDINKCGLLSNLSLELATSIFIKNIRSEIENFNF